MESNAALEEPSIPRHVQRPLGALWISIGLHASMIALVQVAPTTGAGTGARLIEARLVNVPAPAPRSAPDASAPHAPRLAPAARDEAATIEPVAPLAEASPSDGAEPEEAVSDATEPPRDPLAAAPATPPEAPTPPVAVASGVDLTFYSARELDVQPRAVNDIAPTYPEEADRQRISGKVVLELKLEADGRVLDASVVRASPPGIFDAASVAAFEQARFVPAIKNGQPVRAKMLIEVTYDWAGQPLAPRR